MSLNHPLLRLLASPATVASRAKARAPRRTFPGCQQHVHATPSVHGLFDRFWSRKKSEIMKEKEKGSQRQVIKPKPTPEEIAASRLQMLNNLTPSSLTTTGAGAFADEINETKEHARKAKMRQESAARNLYERSDGLSTKEAHLRRAIDPDPLGRMRRHRKMVIKRITNVGTKPFAREPKPALIARTERRHVQKSGKLETSVKKLGMLARQIAGKTVDDAVKQMRFSKKMIAQEVRKELEMARAEAVVKRGMGMPVKGEKKATKAKIVTKDGRRIVVKNPTDLYVEQAWVNRCTPRWRRVKRHGRGRRSRMVSPHTTLSIVLKEEKTRIREHNERDAKKAKAAPWIHLPDRPLTMQRPFYTW